MTLDRKHCQLVPKWLMTLPLEHCHTDCVFMVAIFLNKWTIGTGSLTVVLANTMYWPVTKEISLKDISFFSSGGHIVQLS